MKKFICGLLVASMLGSTALAEIDLKFMSFEELIALQDQVRTEMITRPEWKEVTVPAGCYQIGVDIPAGHWTITNVNGSSGIEYGSNLNESKTGIDFTGWIFGGSISSDEYLRDVFNQSASIELSEGNWIVITGQPVIFTKYVKPVLGF